jgi:hypothetical protein
MFYKIISFSLFLLLISFGATYFYCVRLREGDESHYRQLVRESIELRSKRALERHPARQLRKDVQKDIWTTNGKERSHFRLKSEGSDLLILQRKDKFEATEHLQNLECCLQEEVDVSENRQQLRYLSAKEGTYFFPTHRFLAQAVRLSFFRIGGIELPPSWPATSPFLRGTASEVSFSAAGKSPTFTARRLQAQLDPEKELP